MAAHTGRRQLSTKPPARLEDAIARRRDRMASLAALASASAVAAVLEPAQAPFWEWAAVDRGCGRRRNAAHGRRLPQ